MPHPATGDQGQRYELRAQGYPKDGENVIGWSNDLVWAMTACISICKAPSCKSATVFDRTENETVMYENGE